MKLYIIRHAETEYNRKGIIQGSEFDSDSNDVGYDQAESFYDYYKDVKFEKVYVSNLKRTFQTIIRFTENGVEYEKLKEFNEISWGVNQGKSDDLKDYAELIDSWLAGDLDNKFNEGESPNEISVRLVKGFNKVLEDNHDTVLLCIHGRALKILLSKIIDNDLTKMDRYIHSNTGLYILEYRDGKYEIIGSNLRDHMK